MNEIQLTFALIGIHLAISILIALFFMLITKTEKKYLLLVFAVFHLLTTAVLFIPNLPILDKLDWNWQGKFLSFLLAIVFVYFLPFLTKKEAGFTFKVNKSVWIPFFILTVISVGYNLYTSDLVNGDKSKEYLFFEITMPGLSEETIYRGVLLGLLNLIFIARKNIFGANMGWGALIQAILFGLGHAVFFDENQHLQFYTESFVITFILGVFMTYLKEKGESIIPALLFHNIFNASPALVRLFL